MLQARELRSQYIAFFEKQGALRLPSDSLVTDDPTLMFTVAGMVPFKAYFEDRATPPRTTVTTAQKCLRTKDIEDIGDISHCTFFEMMGNFSFGDYFKEEAVIWAWEFLTTVVGIDAKLLRVTIFADDDETYALWRRCGLPDERISRLGEKTNYWPSNAIAERSQGPCGPCSEIFFDLQPQEPFNADWDGEGSRWLEIWNLVFTQFTGRGEGENFQLVPLPKKNIDTGMGLERTAAAINGLSGPFETDVLRPVIARLEMLSGKTYTSSPDSATDIAFRRVADHIRATVFLLSDGVTPDRGGRGYVLRRLMRRAIVAGIRTLGFDKSPFLSEVVPTVVELMRDAYPDLADRQAYIVGQADQEETLFRRTLQNGLARLEDALRDGNLTGGEAFFLYETFGLPFEITQEIAGERGIEVGEEAYRLAEEEARQKSRAAAGDVVVWGAGNKDFSDLLKSLPPTRFVGHDKMADTVKLIGIVKEGAPVFKVAAGDEADLIFEKTPFYAESGGQMGDTGFVTANVNAFDVSDTKKKDGLWFHKGRVRAGVFSVGNDVAARVDVERRTQIVRNHTATHLLHKALRDRLGDHVQQRGSLVAPDRLRFDFAHGQAMSIDDLRAVEQEVNSAVLGGLPVEIAELPIEEARKLGAMMLFGEKYGDTVRVVSIGGEYSREFCGGTHVQNASQIGSFRLVSEGSAAAGVRRVEAVTGAGAYEHDLDIANRLRSAAGLLGTQPAQVLDAIQRLQTELKMTKQQLQQARQAQSGNVAETLVGQAEQIGGVAVIIAQIETDTGDALPALTEDILNRLVQVSGAAHGGVVLLAAAVNGKILFAAKLSKEAVGRGAHAGDMVKAAAQATGGGGGGRPDFAQAGGKDVTKIGDALAAARAVLVAKLSKSAA